VPPLHADEIARLLPELEGWRVVDQHHLTKNFVFPDFALALAYVNRIGEVAEREGHHPDIYLTWGKARIDIYTHAIDGLTESDFVLAAKIDKVPRA
jgi:4a-hydroxytetrahydrobiopterin dehydratase